MLGWVSIGTRSFIMFEGILKNWLLNPKGLHAICFRTNNKRCFLISVLTFINYGIILEVMLHN